MDPSTSRARIPDRISRVAFLQVWEAASADAQDGWLCEMRANIGLLQVKPGFVSMVLHRSPDQKNHCLYAQWADQHHLESAISDPVVKGARTKLDRWGQPDGRSYEFRSLTMPRTSSGAALEVLPDGAISFVNVWQCGDADRRGTPPSGDGRGSPSNRCPRWFPGNGAPCES